MTSLSFLNPIQIIATCPNDCTPYLANELRTLGALDVKEEYAAVSCTVDEELFYKLHLQCRSASRLLLVIRSFSAKDQKMLFDQARRIQWQQIISSNKTFIIEGVQTNRGPEHMTSNDISKRIREALLDRFAREDIKPPRVQLKEPDISFVGYLEKTRCTICIDTSGKSMHKRGYRLDGHPAPIKETLAATLLQICGYDGSQALLDPMCGSGTIAIEAAMMALNKAPLIHRKRGEFGFEALQFFNRDLWKKVQDECRLQKSPELTAPIYARDISRHFVEQAKKNALRARVERYIDFSVGSFFEEDAPCTQGLLLCNLPYGERIASTAGQDKEFYIEIGNTLKRRYKGWKAALLTSDDTPYKFIGLKPKRKIKLMNGSIPVKLLIFELW